MGHRDGVSGVGGSWPEIGRGGGDEFLGEKGIFGKKVCH